MPDTRCQPRLHAVLLAIIFLANAVFAHAQTSLESIEAEGIERNEERRDAQSQIEGVGNNTRELLNDYRAELKIVEGLETYITMLDQQLAAQDSEIQTLQKSITDVAVIERQILPLLARMIDGLEQFIALDMPFLPQERRERVLAMRGLLSRADVTVAEKARRVFEAYQIESDYGRTIEAYRGKLELLDGNFDADFLRIGRIGLIYRSVGDERLGYWNSSAGVWDVLPSTPYRRLMEKGLRVARQEVAPELISIPIDPALVENSQ
ncbi:DUF3450 domain-containing protein [Congregibacter variabilis]|uniref:DUF3450 domain-containing protein n=1 Tax=Congregibacter variabilis TaxID=3081200 RepID=A0ABZ0I0R4_9GAMM|nr:DUF3450 domain-containing protein [Congregibacter sp. IMCC43200]